MARNTMDLSLRQLTLSPDYDEVTIIFNENIMIAPTSEGGESEEKVIPIKFGPIKITPHDDLINSMKKLRKHGLQIVDVECDAKGDAKPRDLASWSVLDIKIAGDMHKKNSRVVMKLYHLVKSTGKIIPVGPIPEMTMYPTDDDKSKYHKFEEVTGIIEDLVEECWSYLNGKYGSEIKDSDGQLKLFPTEKLELNFSK